MRRRRKVTIRMALGVGIIIITSLREWLWMEEGILRRCIMLLLLMVYRRLKRLVLSSMRIN